MRHRLKIFRWLQRLSLESEDGAAEASWSVWEGPKPEGGQRGWYWQWRISLLSADRRPARGVCTAKQVAASDAVR
jgi:hypothetical protein